MVARWITLIGLVAACTRNDGATLDASEAIDAFKRLDAGIDKSDRKSVV